MKRLFTIIATVLLAISISTSAFAHSHLGGSNPADGDIVTEPLNEIMLEFEGNIEQGSFIDVITSEGQVVEIQEIIVEEDTLTGTLAEPLSNDEYQVNWNIISADGHPLEGEFSFTVDAEVPQSAEGETEEPLETPEADEGEEITDTTESTEDEVSTISAEDEEQGSSSMTIILIVLGLVIVIGGFFLLRKRK